MRQAGKPLDQPRDLRRRAEGVDVPAAFTEPAIDAIGQRTGIRHRSIESAFGASHATCFAKGLVEGCEVLETVVPHSQVKTLRAKRKTRSIARHITAGATSRQDFEIDPHDQQVLSRGMKTPG